MFYAKFFSKFGNMARFHLGTWRVFTWELGTFLLGKLAHFHLGSWLIFTWEVGAFSLGKLAQNPNMFYPPNLSNSSL